MNLRLPDKLLHKVWSFFLGLLIQIVGVWDLNGISMDFNMSSIEFQWDCCSSSVTLLCAAWFTGPGPPKTEVPAVPAVPVVAAVPAVAPAVVSVAPMVAQVPPQAPVSSLRFKAKVGQEGQWNSEFGLQDYFDFFDIVWTLDC